MDDDDFWGGTNPSDVSIDTTKSKDHITELRTHEYKEIVPLELLNEVLNVPQACDSVKKYQLDSSDKSKDPNILSKTNNATHAKGIDLLSEENQDNYNQNYRKNTAIQLYIMVVIVVSKLNL